MKRSIRLAACDPCRQLKMACDHKRPVCTRCARSDRSGRCTYREKPFKKRHHTSTSQTQTPLTQRSNSQGRSFVSRSTTEQERPERHYPNSGHLGLSSSASIFNRLPPSNDVQANTPSQSTPATPGQMCSRSRSLKQQVQILEEAFSTIDGPLLERFMDFWFAKRVCLGLSSSFAKACIQTLQQLLKGRLFNTSNLTEIAQKISENSAQPPSLSASSSLDELVQQISNTSVRWETIALALMWAGRATTDIPFFPPLYTTYSELRAFQRSLADLSDGCLGIALSLDSMSEFQLICQYESFILHSFVYGDQSYDVWRRLGDVISSFLFLGLHEEITDHSEIPFFLVELRRSAFAQIYADDKNMAVFLGRPPRLNRTFCSFQLPGGNLNGDSRAHSTRRPMADMNYVFFGPGDQIDYTTGLRWTACCASLKEEILEVLQEHNSLAEGAIQHLAAIHTRAESLWFSLPEDLRLEMSLSPTEEKSPLERDSLLSIRLTYLQILFLTKISVVMRGNTTFDDDELKLLQISQEMLSLVVEAVILRDRLVNSGTSVHWKVIHYGLPAAGVICYSMLRRSFWHPCAQSLSISKLMQDLGVFASEVQIGGLLQTEAPNYALLHRATSTIQSFLQTALSPNGPLSDLSNIEYGNQNLSQEDLQTQTDFVPFDLSGYTDLWGSEFDFWQDLGAHPSLMTSGVQ